MVRVIEYTLDDPGRPGSGQRHRLLTTLLDAGADPAAELIMLYHERWEEELTFDELKTHQRERPVLRSQTPRGWCRSWTALLLAHYVVRALMHEAAHGGGAGPATAVVRGGVAGAAVPAAGVPGGRRRAAGRGIRNWWRRWARRCCRQRRDRVNPRVVRCPRIPWAKKKPKHRDYPQPTKEFTASIVMLR